MDLTDAQRREQALSDSCFPRDAAPSDGLARLTVRRTPTNRAQQVMVAAGGCVTADEAEAFARAILEVVREVRAEPWPKGCARCGFRGRGDHTYNCPTRRCKGVHDANGRTTHVDGSKSCGCGVALAGNIPPVRVGRRS